MKINVSLTIILSCAVISGCAIGPNYKKPNIDMPANYRSNLIDRNGSSLSIGDQKWWDVFQDKKLQDLIHTALVQNYDLHIAADHILEAQDQLSITNSYQLPTLTASASAPVGIPRELAVERAAVLSD